MTTVKEPSTGPQPASFFKSVISKLKLQQPSEDPVTKPSDKLADPTRIGVLSDEPERRTSLNVSASRCQFTFADGRQCKTPPMQLCVHHASKQQWGAKRVSDASALEALCADLTNATSINRALAQTFLLMAQGHISRKDAVAFGYLSQLLLQSVSGVRAEYVAANGYRQWENKLKTSLTPNADDDPEPSPGEDNSESAVSFSKSDDPARTVIPSSGESHQQDELSPVNRVRSERGIPPKPLPVNKVKRERRIPPNPPQERPLAERIMGQPDYADILSRSLAMLDRKYDFTPEGRSEAQKLALELELMKPAPEKPAKGFFGQTVDLMRRFRDAEEQNSDAASIPPALDYYGHPIKMHVTPPPWADKQDALPPARGTATPGCANPNLSASRSEPPTAPDPETRSSARGDFLAPHSRRHRKPRSHSSTQGCAPHSEAPSQLPISVTTAKPDSVGGADDEHHEGHRTDWYAPPSWSKTRPPDPFPSRKEKLQRKLRSMSNSALRRLQHRNSREL